MRCNIETKSLGRGELRLGRKPPKAQMRLPDLPESARPSTYAAQRIFREARRPRREARARVRRWIRDYGSHTSGRTQDFESLWAWPRGLEFEALGLVVMINCFERAAELTEDLRKIFVGFDKGRAKSKRVAKFYHGLGQLA